MLRDSLLRQNSSSVDYIIELCFLDNVLSGDQDLLQSRKYLFRICNELIIDKLNSRVRKTC